MGTTLTGLTGLTTGGGFLGQWAVAIEGISTLITDGPTARLVTAWSGTDWSSAVSGLAIRWGEGQRIKPWSTELSTPTVRLVVVSGSTDTLGTLMFRRDGGDETKLTTAIDNNDTTVTVASTSDFASSGEAHIGTECFAYSSKAATTFTVSTRGKYSPFTAASSARFAPAHPLPSTDILQVDLKPEVTELPRVWVGRWVAIWLHRNVAGTLDVKAQAQLVFAGKIVGTGYDALGNVWIDVEDMRGVIRDTVLLRDQWTAKVEDGVYLYAGQKFSVICTAEGESPETSTTDPLEVVTGASGSYQLEAGVTTYDNLIRALNAWLSAEYDATTIEHLIGFGLDGNKHTSVGVTHAVSTTHNIVFVFPTNVAKFLGWDSGAINDGNITFGGTIQIVYSPKVAYRRYFWGAAAVDVIDESGTFWDNNTYLPSYLQTHDGVSTGVVQFSDGSLATVEYTAGTIFVVRGSDQQDILNQMSNKPFDLGSFMASRMDTSGEMTVKQVAVIQGSFAQNVMRFLSSTGTASFNGTYDVLAGQLGAAIPIQLITTLATDLLALTEADSPQVTVIEKPTRFWDAFGGAFLARSAALVWKNQELRATIWSTPTASTALHSFTEANKSEPFGRVAQHAAPATEDDSFLVNMVKLEYNRILEGSGDKYLDTITIADLAGMSEHGQRAVTIKLRDVFGGLATSRSPVEGIAAEIAKWMPLFVRPVLVVRRSISLAFYEGCAPGDHCTISDDAIRDPATGTRGVASKPGLIISHRVDWGGFDVGEGLPAPRDMIGEVDLLLFRRDRVKPYCPCAQVDHTAGGGGYNAGSKTLTFKAHEHSESSEAVDVSHFAAGDKVRIIEIDPATLGTPQTWSDTLVSVNTGANTAVLTTGLAGFSSSLKYRMIADSYSTVVTTQKTKAFQAGTDDTIASGAAADEWGRGTSASTWTEDSVISTTLTELPPSPGSTYSTGQGRPMDVGYERTAARLLNALVNHRTAPQLGMISGKLPITGGGTVRKIMFILPITICPGRLEQGDRKLLVGPQWRSSDGASATLIVSLCRGLPVGDSTSISDADNPGYVLTGPYEQVTYTTTSTTYDIDGPDEFSCGVLDEEGEGWLIVEGNSKAQVLGFPLLCAMEYEG